jgi:hypothetical protein
VGVTKRWPCDSLPAEIFRLFILLPLTRCFSITLQPRHNGDYLWPILLYLTSPSVWVLSLLSPLHAVLLNESPVRTPPQRSLSLALITPNHRSTFMIVLYICLGFVSWLSTFEWGSYDWTRNSLTVVLFGCYVLHLHLSFNVFIGEKPWNKLHYQKPSRWRRL